MTHATRVMSMGVLVTLLAPALGSSAGADWLFTPFYGGTFAASTTLPDLDQGVESTKPTFGGSVGWLDEGLGLGLGVELELAFAPRFFEGDAARLFESSNVTTVSLGLLVAAPVSLTREALRPYLVAGGGWMHAAIEEVQPVFPELFGRARNSPGFYIGAGAIGYLTDRTGLRFEVRNLRTFERDDNPFTGERGALLSFWRATVGVVIRR